jgi:hypothetical protein
VQAPLVPVAESQAAGTPPGDGSTEKKEEEQARQEAPLANLNSAKAEAKLVICGCNAGLFREALHDVYIPRIQRGVTGLSPVIITVRIPHRVAMTGDGTNDAPAPSSACWRS